MPPPSFPHIRGDMGTTHIAGVLTGSTNVNYIHTHIHTYIHTRTGTAMSREHNR